jgi:hypothetical protein
MNPLLTPINTLKQARLSRKMARLLLQHPAGATVMSALWGVPPLVAWLYLFARSLPKTHTR